MNVLFLIFNRPYETYRVFEQIRKAKPSKLFIAADGPRKNNLNDLKLCKDAREIVSKIDWPCTISTRFQENNLGCKMHVSSAISWFFNQVDQGIILEDDCLPDQSFFYFAELMLEKYKNISEIMHINGTNFQFGNKRGDASYYFSRCPHVWGWATWKRAWQQYDVEMNNLNQYIKSKKIYDLFEKKLSAKFWISLFKHIKSKKIDTWDAQWAYTIMKSCSLAVTPNYNLVKNIGFGISSTHTRSNNNKLEQESSHLPSIIHPKTISPNTGADTFLIEKIYLKPWYIQIFLKFSNILKMR